MRRDAALQDAIKSRIRKSIEADRVQLTTELHVALDPIGYSIGADDLSQVAIDTWHEVEPLINLFFLNADRAPLSAEAGRDHFQLSFWQRLHPQVVAVAQTRFESGHFADAVEAAMKSVNARVKARVLDTTKQELDGAALMNRAFSPKSPVIRLGDESESGRSTQLGYMQLFSGSMTGVRNPKAHGNIDISPSRAEHLLFLASLLMYRLDEEIVEPNVSINEEARN